MATSDDIWSQALQEAYASAPVDEVILHTIELRHSSFKNLEGEIQPIRLISDYGELLEEGDPDIYGYRLGLESTAPMNGGEQVIFQAVMFDFTLPDQTEGTLPSIEIKIDNVSREISQYLDDAVNLDEPIELIYREYLLSEKDEPQFVLDGMTIQIVKTSVFSVSATASFADLVNRNFPGKIYRPQDFRGLIS